MQRVMHLPRTGVASASRGGVAGSLNAPAMMSLLFVAVFAVAGLALGLFAAFAIYSFLSLIGHPLGDADGTSALYPLFGSCGSALGVVFALLLNR